VPRGRGDGVDGNEVPEDEMADEEENSTHSISPGRSDGKGLEKNGSDDSMMLFAGQANE
jgi:hypothetical protein